MSENKIKDGGPAFPGPGEQFVSGVHGIQPQSAYGMQGSEGMSLRDYFAGQFLSGYPACFAGTDYPLPVPETCAALAYRYADAMLAAREPSNPK